MSSLGSLISRTCLGSRSLLVCKSSSSLWPSTPLRQHHLSTAIVSSKRGMTRHLLLNDPKVQHQLQSQRCFFLTPLGKNLSSDSGSGDKKSSIAEEILKAKAEEESKSKTEEEADKTWWGKPVPKWQKIGQIAFFTSLFGGIIIGAVVFSLPDKDENGNDIEDEFSSLPFLSQHYRRCKSRFFKTKQDLENPFSDKLLPDPLPEPYIQPKYTVLIELTGLLVHSIWTPKHGWRFQKRPGVDIFLSQLGYPNFELVVFTVENSTTFYPIVDGLDPQSQFIMYRLFRDATRYLNGFHQKDVSALNRDPKKVIILDWNKNNVSLNPENALILPKWEGDNNDRQLIGLAQLLLAIKDTNVDDVREVLEYYKQFEDPIEAFRENQRKLQAEMEQQEKKKAGDTQKGSILSSVKSSFGFGRM